MIDVGDLTSDVVALETADVGLAALDALFAAWCALLRLADGVCQRLWVVGADIETVRTACLFQAGARTGHHGQSTTDGLDDGDAKTLVDGGIDETLGLGIQRRQVGIGHVVEDEHTTMEAVRRHIVHHQVRVRRAMAHDDERQALPRRGWARS